MAKTVPVGREPIGIGRRARVIRRLRGLTLDTVAGLTGIPEHDLSMLESGERRFGRRGLIEDLADVAAGLAGISKAHLSLLETGQRGS